MEKIGKGFRKTKEFRQFPESEAAKRLMKHKILKNPKNLLEEAVAASARVYKAQQEWRLPSWRDFVFHKIAAKTVYPGIREGLEETFGNKMKFILGGSAALPSGVQDFFRVLGKSRARGDPDFTIHQGYGTAETSPVIAVNTPDAYLLDTKNWGVAPSGKIIPGVKVVIADSDLLSQEGKIKPVKSGETGTILVNGPNVFSRYYHDDKRTSEAFIKEDAGKRWFNTRDRGLTRKARRDKHGRGDYLVVLGRNARLIVFPGGRKESPEKVEAAYRLQFAEQVGEVLCVGSKIRERFSLVAIANQGLRDSIKSTRLAKEEVEAKMRATIDSDSKARFGMEIDRVYLDTEISQEDVTTSLGKLRFKKYLEQLEDRGVLKEVNALDNTTRYV